MTTVQQIHFASQDIAVQQGRSSHGRWRYGARPAGQPSPAAGRRAALAVIQDAERMAFALVEGPAAQRISTHLSGNLWKHSDQLVDWPGPLHAWLAETASWEDIPAGRNGFICGRLERHMPGGRITLAWVGMRGIQLVDGTHRPIALDTHIAEDESWSPGQSEEVSLHLHRGVLHNITRLMLYTGNLHPLSRELPDMANVDLDRALTDIATHATGDLAVFDLRLNAVGTPPNSVNLRYRWDSPEQCQLAWTPTEGATAFRIEESDTPTFDQPKILAEMTDIRQTHYRFSPPASETRYYRVIPLADGTPGTASDPIRVTPVVLTAPIMEPVGWSGEGGFVLNWTPIPQASSYEVQSSPSSSFDGEGVRIVYRGASSTVHLPPDTAASQFYRVRALNVIYAAQTPSAWSEPRRAPDRLATPVITSVTESQITWDPVPGASQYAVRVTPKDATSDPGEIISTGQASLPAADRAARYEIRALRHVGDQRTASEWSRPISLVPPYANRPFGGGSLRLTLPVFVGLAVAALLVGGALSLAGWSIYRDTNATHTPTMLPAALVQATLTQDAIHLDNATAVIVMEAGIDALEATGTDQAHAQTTLEAVNTAAQQTIQARLDAEQTQTHIPTLTPSPTPDVTGTAGAFLAGALTETAAAWTATPPPTATPNATRTVSAFLASALTKTAAAWTPTPTPSTTPTVTRTPTATPSASPTLTPSRTPDATRTVEAFLKDALTATAADWTATPDWQQTLEASVNEALPAGLCLLTDRDLPVLSAVRLDAEPADVPANAVILVTSQLERRSASGATLEIWLGLRILSTRGTTREWLRVPDQAAPNTLYRGDGCPPPSVIEIAPDQ